MVTDSTEANISGATSSTYTPVEADLGKTLKVKVNFTDDDGNPETRTSTATASVTLSEKAALEALYDATAGAAWTNSSNWKSSSPLGNWYGVTTDVDGRVTEVDLYENNLDGSIPGALGNLAELKTLSLGSNSLAGSIPVELGNLPKLEQFSVEKSSLNGEIPSVLGNLSALKYLWLQENSLSGSIPDSLASRTSLIQLHLNDNSLSGTIPAKLGDLTSLIQLDLQNNKLTGVIPAQLGNMTALLYLHLNSNELSGTIPVQLGQLTKLIGVRLNDNTDLTGEIPFDARQSALGYLIVSNTDLCAPPTLHAFWDTNLVYDGTACTMSRTDRTLLESLYDSTAGGDWGDGTNWKSIQPLADWHGVETNEAGRVTGLSLPNIGLAGAIPDDLGALTWLETLDLSGNGLTGVIPDALDALIRLRRLDLSGNTLTGGIPSWLGDLDRLEHLDLSDTQLSGSIPSSFTRTSALRTLDVSRTTVCMPPDLDFQNWLDDSRIVYRGDRCERTDRTALVALYYATDGPSWMRANWLSDAPLDDWDGGGANADNRVIWVLIGGFGLNGTIPRELGDLALLEQLVLDTNALTGPLPRELGKLTNLQILSVAETGLTGPIPTELQQLPLHQLGIDDTGLCVPRNPAFRAWLIEVVKPKTLTLKTCPGGPPSGPPSAPPREPVPDAPTNLLADGGNEQVALSWDAPENDGGTGITDYEYRIDGKGRWISIGSAGTTHTVTGLVNGTEYTFQVRAVSRVGRSRASNRAEATPGVGGLDFAHFAKGAGITSDLVFVNVAPHPIRPAPTPFHSDILPNLPVFYFYDQGGDLIDPGSVVDVTGDLMVTEDGGLSVQTEMPPLGELTISTHGRGDLLSGSVKITSERPLGGFLRFSLPGIGVTGVGASQPVRDAIFPARRQAGGITTAAAIRNLSESELVATCRLMKEGMVLEEVEIPLAPNGQESQYIEEMFTGADTSDFVGSVRCTVPPGEGMFTGVAVEIDAESRILTTLPVVPVQR